MALNVDLRVLTQPGTIGNQTLSLAANFDPKAIILWGSAVAADVGTKAHAQFGIGYGTYRGSVVQQCFVTSDAQDAATTGNTAAEVGADALLVLLTSAAPGSRDLEIDLVSMQTGATSQVVINWVNLHGTASVRINCLILGGSDISDALALLWTMTTAVATQDVTVTTGFGQPDFLFMGQAAADDANGIVAGTSLSQGFGKKGEAGRCTAYASRDGNTTMFVGMTQRSDKILRVLDPTADPFLETSCSLNTAPATNWPTDGFQIDYDVQASFAHDIACLALKGTFTATTGNGTAPTSGSLPVTQNLAHGSAPKLGFIQGWNLIAGTGLDTTAADLGSFSVGAGDGTVEVACGISDDDALGTSDCNSRQANTKVIRNYNAGVTLQSEADGSISGNNFVLSWNDIDTVAREYQWFTLGNAVGAVLVTPGTASLTTTRFAPTVLTPRLVTPGVVSLVTTRFAPSVTVGVRVTPATASLTLVKFAPTVLTPRLVTPGVAALTTTRFAPTVRIGVRVIPGTLALLLTMFAPTVTGGGAEPAVVMDILLGWRHRARR